MQRPDVHRPSGADVDDDDDEYEVIALSPSSSAPVLNYRRPRSSIMFPLEQSHSAASSSHLNTVPECGGPAVYVPTQGGRRGGSEYGDLQKQRMGAAASIDENLMEGRGTQPYFGERLSQFDMIANNIENAFVRMR